MILIAIVLIGGVMLGFSAAWVFFNTPTSDSTQVSELWLKNHIYDKGGFDR